jgi:hypothetical protein
MKMVKSLLLGAAAGLVAVAGAQAADLPVKAKPVQYVKICSLYGAGFYYIPGTDTCIKLGGFVRAETNVNSGGSFGPTLADNKTRASNDVQNRVRGLLSIDARSQTAYGTLRSYLRGAFQWTTNDFQVGGSQGAGQLTPTSSRTGQFLASSSTTYFDRAFIQLGGWTFGKTESFFDFFPTGNYSLQTAFLYNDNGGNGQPVIAYTYGFGNGWTATISAEDNSEMKLPLVGVGGTTTATSVAAAAAANPNLSITGGGSSVAANAGNVVPDVVANVRVDQVWGSAQASIAGHDNRVAYDGGPLPFTQTHPSDKWGFAGQLGITFNLPMISKGDTLSLQASYCDGATRYCANQSGGNTGAGNFYGLRKGTTIGVAWLEDGYFNALTGGSLELAKAYSLVAGFNHFWMPNLQTSLYGAYLNFKSDSAAVDLLSCQAAAQVAAGVSATGCRDFSAYQIGSRTLWNPVANLDVGVDVMYHRVQSAYVGNGVTPFAGAGTGFAAAAAGDVGQFAGIVRVQRNFWP